MAYEMWILIVAVIAVVSGEENPSVDIKVLPAGEITQDQVVTVECDVTGKIHHTAAFYLVRIANGIESKVADIQRVAEDFEAEGRYSMEYTGEEGHMTFTVTIDGVKGSDSGILKCVFTQRGVPYTAEQEVRVLVPVKSVEIVQITNTTKIPALDDVQLEHNRHAGVGCLVKVEGTLVTPNTIIETGTNIEFTLAEDETHQEVIKGQWLASREMLYQYKEEFPSLELHGKTIKCVASLPGFSEEASAVIRVYTVPEVNCEEKQAAKLGEKATLTCTVRSSPSPDLDKTAWTWRPKQGNKTNLSMGDSLARHTAKLEDLGTNLDYVATLDIDQVEAADFVNYKLEVVNDQGKLKRAVQLQEVVTSTTTTTVATTTATQKQETTASDDGDKSEPIVGPGGSASGPILNLVLTLTTLLMSLCFTSS